MKTPTNLYSRLALITSVTLVVGYFVVYAAYQTFTSPEYQSGAALSSTFLGKVVSNLDEINGRVTTLEGSIAGANVWSKVGSDINYTAGKVGVGATTGNAELDIQSGIKPHWGIYHDSTTEELRFWNGDNRVVIGSGGSVGIGTNLPQRELHINSTNGAQIELQGTVGSWDGLQFINTGYNGYTGLMESDGRFFIDTASNGEDLTILQNGNVGIGTTGPSQKLSIGNYNTNNNIWISRVVNGADPVGAIRSYIAIGISDISETYVGTGDSHTWKIGSMVSGWVNPIYGYNTHYNDDLSFSYKQRGYAEVTAMIIQGGTGNVGIGTTTPGTDKLYVNGTARGTSWTNISDLRFKKNITPITSALDAIEKLQGVSFDWRIGEFTNRNFPEGKQIGFIAQDVEKVVPEVVTTDNDGYKGVEYANITAVLVEAMKELKSQKDSEIAELRKEIQELKNK